MSIENQRSIKIFPMLLEYLNVAVALMAAILVIVSLFKGDWGRAVLWAIYDIFFFVGYAIYAKDRMPKQLFKLGIWDTKRYVFTLGMGAIVIYGFFLLLIGKY